MMRSPLKPEGNRENGLGSIAGLRITRIQLGGDTALNYKERHMSKKGQFALGIAFVGLFAWNKSRVTQLRRLSLFAVFATAVLLPPVRAGAATNGVHAAIVIQSDADFTNCACVTSGAGTTASPFIIGPWSINNVDGDGVFID